MALRQMIFYAKCLKIGLDKTALLVYNINRDSILYALSAFKAVISLSG